MRSTTRVDDPVYEVPEGWDGVFNVVTKDFAEKNGITVNCGVTNGEGDKIGCARCKTGCYDLNSKGVVVFEIQK
jgi:hypothetical protein